MPLDLATLAAGIARVEIPYGDETLAVDYRPERITGRTYGVLQRAGRGGELDLDALYAELGAILVWWDLTDAHEPVGTDPAALERLGFGLLSSVLAGVLADAADPTRAAARRKGTAATSNGSSPTAILGPAPTTTTSSRPPGGPVFTRPSSPASPTPEPPYAGAPG